VGLNQNIAALSLPGQSDPAICGKNDTLWPLERDT
jgi:hypothetical protein